jgi:hypothetical protein
MNAVVGIGTLALAAATFALAWVALRTLDLQQTQTERAHRPVLVPASGVSEIHFRHGRTASKEPMKLGSDKVALPIQNIGMGPALNVRGLADAGGSSAIWGTGRTLHAIEGVAAGQANAAVFTQDADGLFDLQMELWVRLLYEDVAGMTYWTDLHYNSSTKGYAARTAGPAAHEPESSLPSARRVTAVLPHLGS